MISKCRKHDCWPEWEGLAEIIGMEVGGRFYCPICRLEEQVKIYKNAAAKWNQKQEQHDKEES